MLDLNNRIPGARNFKYKELIRSDIANRRNINNIPNSSQWELLEVLAVNVLQPIRNKFGGIRITSGFRCLELNKVLRSSDRSLHAIGAAVDFEPINIDVKLFDVLEWVYFNCDYRELIAEYFNNNGWIHVGHVDGWNVKALKLKDSNHNYDGVDISYLKRMYG